MYQSVGERLNAIISFIISRLKRCLGFRRHKVSGFELITVEFGMSTLLILGGSYVFSKQERWTYLQSIYYSLVTFWTIGNENELFFFFFSFFVFVCSGFGDFVPLVSVQRSGQSLYSRWGYYIFTISYILFGLAIMASSLNLLVLRLAQFHSENGLGGISALLGRNEEELIAAAIAEHRASIHIQHRQRIQSLHPTNNLFDEKRAIASLASIKSNSWWSTSTGSCSTLSFESKFDAFQKDQCSIGRTCLGKKRRKRHWHLRRSPQNIKHLLTMNPKRFYGRKSFLNNHISSNHCQLRGETQQQTKRISI